MNNDSMDEILSAWSRARPAPAVERVAPQLKAQIFQAIAERRETQKLLFLPLGFSSLRAQLSLAATAIALALIASLFSVQRELNREEAKAFLASRSLDFESLTQGAYFDLDR